MKKEYCPIDIGSILSLPE